MSKEIILSGIRPTGKLHIGNYLGALKNFVELQNKYECYFFIADLHSLNETFDPKIKQEQIFDLARDFLAAGLDPKKCTIFVQSHIPEHSELAIILSNIIPVSFLFRMTQYKEKAEERANENVNAGLLYYPVLMAADILAYKPTKIPVGQDQTQHVELAQEVARFFNNKFGQTFPEPKPFYTESPKVMSLLNPEKKMAKTLGDNHCLYLDDSPEIIAQKLARAVTDSGDAKTAGGQNLLGLVKIFSTKDSYTQFLNQAQKGQLKYSELKTQLAKDIADYFKDFRQAKAKISGQKVQKVLKSGAKKAKKIAAKTMAEVRAKIGLN